MLQPPLPKSNDKLEGNFANAIHTNCTITFKVVRWNKQNTLPETKSKHSHLKMDGWNTIVSFWEGRSSGAMLVSGRVIITTNDGLCKWILRISSSPSDVTCAGDEEVGFYTLEV